jgi:hypothetical protein
MYQNHSRLHNYHWIVTQWHITSRPYCPTWLVLNSSAVQNPSSLLYSWHRKMYWQISVHPQDRDLQEFVGDILLRSLSTSIRSLQWLMGPLLHHSWPPVSEEVSRQQMLTPNCHSWFSEWNFNQWRSNASIVTNNIGLLHLLANILKLKSNNVTQGLQQTTKLQMQGVHWSTEVTTHCYWRITCLLQPLLIQNKTVQLHAVTTYVSWVSAFEV